MMAVAMRIKTNQEKRERNRTNAGELTDSTELDLRVDFRQSVLVVAKTNNEPGCDKEDQNLPDGDAPTADEALAKEAVVEHCLGHTVVWDPVFVAYTSSTINRP